MTVLPRDVSPGRSKETHLRPSELRELFIMLCCWLVLIFHLSLTVSFSRKFIVMHATALFDFDKRSLFSYVFI